ncbi:MAG: serpin family protein [Capsulimonadaceae bacterium]|nr:serpin family protein [Capsulimonadaceae bacterium]
MKYFAALMFLAATIACGPAAFGQSDVITSPEVRAVAAAQNGFAFDLLRRLVQNAPKTNVFISPVSAHLALSLAYSGAAGHTKTEMGKTLCLPAETNQSLQFANAALIQDLTADDDPPGCMQIANSIWANKDSRFSPAFQQACVSDFQASMNVLDFGSPNAADTINRWVKAKTGGKIPSIVDRVSRRDALYLLDAVYFRAAWKTPFPARLTEPQRFTTGSGAGKTVKMMHGHNWYSYGETDVYQAVQVSFEGVRYYMLVVLPRSGHDLPSLAKSITPETWTKLNGSLRICEGDLYLPRVTISYSRELEDDLKALGIREAFSPQADFSAMLQPRSHISRVIHKTDLRVDEDGAEAAAATAVGVMRSTVRIARPQAFTMVVDHPFLCAIVDRKTGAIPFIGTINDPMGK